ncbi:unnamed protein product [Oppiella nova]|uniref:Ig-like domain-containing protein n=1 Tax=Oppiella nova TaxID=334625 RepID=A0A7R9QEA2_9ACAR|nr:unnamed protein product [Oppiella nova]CAG2163595.1 unnamed protein product [Oppiella nova]
MTCDNCTIHGVFAQEEGLDWKKVDVDYYGPKIGIQMTRIETIVVSNASAYDSGFYRCNSFSRNYHRLDVITSEPISSTADPIPEPNIAFEEIKEELSTTIKFKNGIKIEIDDRRTVEESNLIIRDATSVVDSGDYLCRVDSLSSRGGSQFGQMIQLRAPIRVKPFPNTDSVAEGDRRVIRCEYTGYPVGKIRWLIGSICFI